MDRVVGVNAGARSDIAPGTDVDGPGTVQDAKRADDQIRFPAGGLVYLRGYDQIPFTEMLVRIAPGLGDGRIQFFFGHGGRIITQLMP